MQYRFFLLLVFLNGSLVVSQTPLPVAEVGTPYRVQIAWQVASATCPCSVSYETLPSWLSGSPTGLLVGNPRAETKAPVFFSVVVKSDVQNTILGRYQFSVAVVKEAPPVVVMAKPQDDTKPSGGVRAANKDAAPADPPSSGAEGRDEPASPALAAAEHKAGSPEREGLSSGPQASPTTSAGNNKSNEGQKDEAKNPAKGGETPNIKFDGAIADGNKFLRGVAAPLAKVELTRASSVQETTADDKGHFEFSFHNPEDALKAGEELSVRQYIDGAAESPVYRTVTPYYRNGEEARAILGYQQAGASAAKHEQNWFLDFYISRPFKLHGGDDDLTRPSKLRWWGNVRVASYPQQGDVPVATFVSSLAQQFGQLKVNQLAQAAEYVTGLEYNLHSWTAHLGRSENTGQQFALGLFAGGGATGPLDPTSTASVFETPAVASPDRQRFVTQFPKAASTPFIAFVSPDRDNFFRQYFAGLRLTTTYLYPHTREPMISAPAMVSLSLGQNEVVTRGQLHGLVLRTEAFYPLPFFNRAKDKRGALAALYLFGSAQMHLGSSHDVDPFILKPRPDIAASEPTVAVVTSPSNRDIYRIGFGVDFVHMIMALTQKEDGSTKDKGKTTASPGGNAADQASKPAKGGGAQ